MINENHYLENPVQLAGKLGSPTHCLVPHNREVGTTTEVLSDSNCHIKVQHNMPPPTWHKHSFTWLLQDLQLQDTGADLAQSTTQLTGLDG